jgi:transposase
MSDFDKSKWIKTQKEFMKTNIELHNNDIWTPNIDIKMHQVYTNSWFSIKESNQQNTEFIENEYNIEKINRITHASIKVKLFPSTKQKHLLNNWFNISIKMYNIAVRKIKYLLSIKLGINEKTKYDKLYKILSNSETEQKEIFNFRYLRSILYEEKKCLTKRSLIAVNDLDQSIHDACTNFKSATTNFLKRYIVSFNIKNKSKRNKKKITHIAKCRINKNGIRTKILKQMKGIYNGKEYNFENIECDCILQKDNNEYFIFIPIKNKNEIQIIHKNKEEKKPENYIKKQNEIRRIFNTKKESNPDKIKNSVKITRFNKKNIDKDKQITIDLGIRTFCTGITEDKVVKIGDNICSKLGKYIDRKESILNNNLIKRKIKKKNEKICNKKILNLVTELHWKTIDYLVKNNKTIIIGNLKSQKIVSKNKTMYSLTKKISNSLSFYKFMERLKYKCDLNNIKFAKINEFMTSKMCSKCGNIHEELGSNKIYNCYKCNIKMDRDINGARNIHIKAIKNKK